MEKIAYLNLEISKLQQEHMVFLPKQSLKFTCNSHMTSLRHELHTIDNPQLNTIVDLIINLGRSMEQNVKQLQKHNQSTQDILERNNKISKELTESMIHIKRILDDIYINLKKFNKTEFPSKIEFADLINKVKTNQNHQVIESIQNIEYKLQDIKKLILN